MQPEIRDQARNRWQDILSRLGIDTKFLTGRNGPCPKCGGKDRFQFTNLNGVGTWFCRGCGKGGDGIELVQNMHGLDFEEAARMVREVLPDTTEGKPKPRITDDERKAMVTKLWKGSKPLDGEDMASEYLRWRGLGEVRSKALRFHPDCPNGDGDRPAMLATVKDPTGNAYTMHRTYLENARKHSRKLCPGELVPGSYIELAPAGETLGIAEGIETALAVTIRFGCPCWSLISAGNLERFEPPEGVKRLWIFSDNDVKFGGAKSAYALAHRLACKPDPIEIAVRMPVEPGDWADENSA